MLISGNDENQQVLGCIWHVRYEEDFKLAASLGSNAMRISLEWSRIEPQRGKIDESAIRHYHAMFDCLERYLLLDDCPPSFRNPRLECLIAGADQPVNLW